MKKKVVKLDFEKNTETPMFDDYETGCATYKGIYCSYTKIGSVVTLNYLIREDQRKTKITSLPYPLKKKLIRKKRK